MTDEEKALAESLLALLRGAGVKIRAFEDYDNEENYVGTRYYLVRSDEMVDVEDLFDLQFSGGVK